MMHILMPTDFSENAWNAIKYAMALFKRTKCTFYLLHVNPIVAYTSVETTILASAEVVEKTTLKKSKEQLQKVLSQIEHLPFNTVHTFVINSIYGYFVDSIGKEIMDKNIDLVIMGTKGASGLKKLTLGSNTGDVITKVKCPLLAVPENARYSKPREIVFPTDYHIGYSLNALDTLVDMVTIHKATLRILHVFKKDEELGSAQIKNKDFLHDYFKDLQHSFHTVTGSKLETTVQSFVKNRDIDMIAMVAKNLNFLQRILFRPTVEEISYHTDIPFLVLHE